MLPKILTLDDIVHMASSEFGRLPVTVQGYAAIMNNFARRNRVVVVQLSPEDWQHVAAHAAIIEVTRVGQNDKAQRR